MRQESGASASEIREQQRSTMGTHHTDVFANRCIKILAWITFYITGLLNLGLWWRIHFSSLWVNSDMWIVNNNGKHLISFYLLHWPWNWAYQPLKNEKGLNSTFFLLLIKWAFSMGIDHKMGSKVNSWYS